MVMVAAVVAVVVAVLVAWWVWCFLYSNDESHQWTVALRRYSRQHSQDAGLLVGSDGEEEERGREHGGVASDGPCAAQAEERGQQELLPDHWHHPQAGRQGSDC